MAIVASVPGTVGSMDLLLQPFILKVSTWRAPTESRNWQAAADDASDIANKAGGLLHHPTEVQEGATALEVHHAIALIRWESFLQLFPR
jgi:hypothetical protein